MDDRSLEEAAKLLLRADAQGDALYIHFPHRPLERLNLKKFPEAVRTK